MSSKAIPASNRRRSQLAAKMIKGINEKGASIPITMVTEAGMQADLTAFNKAEADFGAMRKALGDAYKVFTPADGALTKWLNVARPALIGHFGYFWSADWAAAGFVNNSTAIPDTIEDRLGLARSLVAFFIANPNVENVNSGATAVVGETKRKAAADAQGAVATADQALKDQEIVRQPATLAILTDMRNVTRNLTGMLTKDDPRWLAFGLDMPATDTTPGKPTGLAAQFDAASGGLILTCDPLPFGLRFRFRGREAGSGLPYQLIGSSSAARRGRSVAPSQSRPAPPWRSWCRP